MLISNSTYSLFYSFQYSSLAQHGEFEVDLGKPPHTAMLVLPALRISIEKSSTNSQVEVQHQNRLLVTVKTAVKSLFSFRRWSFKYI